MQSFRLQRPRGFTKKSGPTRSSRLHLDEHQRLPSITSIKPLRAHPRFCNAEIHGECVQEGFAPVPYENLP